MNSRMRTARQIAHEAIDRLAVEECEHGRDGLHLELLCEDLALVDIDLAELYLALKLGNHAFQNRPERQTGRAPGCPEIHKNRLLLRSREDLFDECIIGDFDDGLVAALHVEHGRPPNPVVSGLQIGLFACLGNHSRPDFAA